jgi:hypothetical protein
VDEKAKCSVCKQNYLYAESEKARGVCEECRKSFGLARRPDRSKRPPRPCGKCGHHVLVRCQIRERAASGGDYVYQYVAPLALTFQRLRRISIWSGKQKVKNKPDPTEPAGILEAFACRSCGYVEWYAQAPGEIPIGPEYGTELIDVTAKPPYR